MEKIHGFTLGAQTRNQKHYINKEEVFEDFSTAYSEASRILRQRIDVTRISIYHTADYEDFKTRKLTTLIKE